MDLTVVDRLNAISELLRRDSQRAFEGTSLTQTRVHALWILGATGPTTQQQLAEQLGTTPRSVSALVDALEHHGYVERRAHPDDRRAVLVTLTDLAMPMMRRMHDNYVRLTADLLAAVDEADRSAFERGLAAVMHRLAHLVEHDRVDYREVEAP